MADSGNVQVRIEGTANVAPAAAQTVEGLKSVEAGTTGLAASMDRLTATMTAGFAAIAAASKVSTGAVTKDLEKEELSLKGISAQMLHMKNSLVGTGEALLAFFAVEQVLNWAKHMGEAGEAVEHTAQEIGTSKTQVQQLNADFAMVGMSSEAGTMAMVRFGRAVEMANAGNKRMTADFKELNVNVKGIHDPMQALAAVMDGFAHHADGMAKTTLAMQLFGRSAKDMIPFLDLGATGLAELNRVTEKYGIQNADAADKTALLGSAFNENHVAMTGLSQVLSQAFAPVLTVVVQETNALIASLIKSYKEGGYVKTVIDELVVGFKVFITTIIFLGATVNTFWAALSSIVRGIAAEIINALSWVGESFQTFEQVVDGVVREVGIELKGLGQLIQDVFTLQWGKIGSDFEAVTGHMARQVVASIKTIQRARATADGEQRETTADSEKFQIDAAAAVEKTWTDAIHGIKAVWAGNPLPQANTTKATGGDDLSLPGAAGKTPKAKTDNSDQYKDELAEWTAQFQAMHEVEGNFWNDDLAGDKAFWAAKLAILQGQTASNKQEAEKLASDIRAVESKMYAISKQMAVEARTEALKQNALKYQEAVTEANKELKLAIDSAKAEEIVVKGKAARGEINGRQEFAAMEEIRAEELKAQLTAITAEEAATEAKHQSNLAVLLKDQKATKDELAAEVKDTQDAEAKMAVAKAAAGLAELAAEQDRLNKISTMWHSHVDGIVGAWSSGMQAMIQGTGTFMGMLNGMWTSLLGDIFNMIALMIEKWIVGELIKTTATRAGVALRTTAQLQGAAVSNAISAQSSLKEITNAALTGAANAYKAMAGIPIIGPVLGAIAAAVTFSAIELFGASVSAEGGMGDVPYDNMPALLHAKEMVLPADIAVPLRQSIASGGQGGAPGGVGAGGRGGDMHLHIQALDGASVQRLFHENGEALFGVVRKQMAMGGMYRG